MHWFIYEPLTIFHASIIFILCTPWTIEHGLSDWIELKLNWSKLFRCRCRYFHFFIIWLYLFVRLQVRAYCLHRLKWTFCFISILVLVLEKKSIHWTRKKTEKQIKMKTQKHDVSSLYKVSPRQSLKWICFTTDKILNHTCGV